VVVVVQLGGVIHLLSSHGLVKNRSEITWHSVDLVLLSWRT